MEDSFVVAGIRIMDRIKEAGRTQQVLSKHAPVIQSRLGFHEVTEAVCSRVGLVVLHLRDAGSRWEALRDDLDKIGGIEVKVMTFNRSQP